MIVISINTAKVTFIKSSHLKRETMGDDFLV